MAQKTTGDNINDKILELKAEVVLDAFVITDVHFIFRNFIFNYLVLLGYDAV
jgi:hypothetical protein